MRMPAQVDVQSRHKIDCLLASIGFSIHEEKEFVKLVELHGGHYARADEADAVEKVREDSDSGSRGEVPVAGGV